MIVCGRETLRYVQNLKGHLRLQTNVGPPQSRSPATTSTATFATTNPHHYVDLDDKTPPNPIISPAQELPDKQCRCRFGQHVGYGQCTRHRPRAQITEEEEGKKREVQDISF